MKNKNIEILKITHLRGPNVWTYRPVLEVLVDIGELEDFPSNTIPGFYERLSQWLPTLVEHRCSYEVRGGFLRRLHEGTWPGHILEHVALELQGLAGVAGGFGRARETEIRGVYKVVVRCWHVDLTTQAIRAARDLVMAAIEDRGYDVGAAVAQLRDIAESVCLGPSTAAIADAADDRRIPTIRLNDGNLVQLGYGARQRRIWTAETDRTSAIAEGISRDKDLTKQLLQSCGVPVPQGRLVESADDAWAAAQEIGLPVVVKPYDANHGRGVFIDLSTREEIGAAYAVALDEGSGVIVERFVVGIEHRLLVVGGRMVAAARGKIASVTGDGRSTVRELIDSQLNTDPLRGSGDDCPLNLVGIDTAVRLELRRQGFESTSVPPAGVEVLIQRNGNVAFDVTDLVHPSVARTVALAARVIGLDIAGVDLVAQDISRPLEEQRGAIVEVNAGPGLQMHLQPAEGAPRPVGRAIVDHLFADGEDGRIPVVGIAGSRGRTTTARLLANLLSLHGVKAGVASVDGLFIGERRIGAGDSANFDAAQKLLVNRAVEVAVIENGPRAIATEGLAYDRCRVGIVTGFDPHDLLAELHLGTPDEMVKVLRSQVDVVLPDGVAILNADDPEVAAMAQLSDGEVILFSREPANEAIAAHRAAGGRAVLAHGAGLVLARGNSESTLARIAQVPLLGSDHDAVDAASLLAAVGAAWALEIPQELIRVGVETFARIAAREAAFH